MFQLRYVLNIDETESFKAINYSKFEDAVEYSEKLMDLFWNRIQERPNDKKKIMVWITDDANHRYDITYGKDKKVYVTKTR